MKQEGLSDEELKKEYNKNYEQLVHNSHKSAETGSSLKNIFESYDDYKKQFNFD